MLLLLFGSTTSAASGHPARSVSGRNRARQVAMPNDDEAALQMLLDAEDADVLDALIAYDSALRRLL